jgi:ketosteroid isomerase-like protein
MKNFILLIALIFGISLVNAQTKNGTVFSEHPKIETTKAIWDAFQKGDQDTYIGFFADSVYRFVNGNMAHITKENLKGAMEYWSEAYKNLKVRDEKPATPDAIEYNEGGTWVQDWLLVSGTHKETGINVDVSFHNLYRFNDEGKVDVIYYYFDDAVFEEIENSQKTKENGIVYVNHPYINTVRKVLNAFAEKDVDAWASFFSPKARFWYATMPTTEYKTFEETKARLTKQFETQGDVKFEQQGYPDCVYYEKNDMYAVYSWWTFIGEENGKKLEYPLMFTHNFDKDGKIIFVMVYYSTNHFE